MIFYLHVDFDFCFFVANMYSHGCQIVLKHQSGDQGCHTSPGWGVRRYFLKRNDAICMQCLHKYIDIQDVFR